MSDQKHLEEREYSEQELKDALDVMEFYSLVMKELTKKCPGVQEVLPAVYRGVIPRHPLIKHLLENSPNFKPYKAFLDGIVKEKEITQAIVEQSKD